MYTELKIESELAKMKPAGKNENFNIDLDGMLKECMGKVELLTELVRLFKKNVLEFIGSVKVNLENEDIEKIGFASHKIKTSLRMMRIDGLLYIAEQIDLICKNDKDIKYIRFLYEQFVDEYPHIEEALDNELKKFK